MCLSNNCKHDFCKKALFDFNVTCGVSWYDGLTVQNVNFLLHTALCPTQLSHRDRVTLRDVENLAVTQVIGNGTVR